MALETVLLESALLDTTSAETTLERLRVLSAIASSGTIASAARSLGYTASAVSQHLSSLEREAQVALVERSNRGVTLTPAGRLLAQRSGDILDRVRNAFIDVRASASDYETTLVIAAFPTAITSMLLPIRRLLDPSTRLRIIDAESAEALRALASREIDGAITDGTARFSNPEFKTLERFPLRSEPIRVITRASSVITSLSELSEAEWVLGGPRTPIGQAVRQFCHAAGFSPNVIAQTDDHRITFDVVQATGAVSVLPDLALTSIPEGICVADQIQLGYTRSIEFTTRQSLSSNAPIKQLLQLLNMP